jgi:hypothetical protein
MTLKLDELRHLGRKHDIITLVIVRLSFLLQILLFYVFYTSYVRLFGTDMTLSAEFFVTGIYSVPGLRGAVLYAI